MYYRRLPLALLLLALGWLILTPPEAVAQDVPNTVPDGTPDAVPEQHGEQLKERHRALVSRFFTGGQVAAAPAWAGGPSALGVQVEAGLDVGVHDALYLTLGVREYVETGAAEAGAAGWPRRDKEVSALFSANYEVGLARYFEDTAFARRAAVGVGAGFIKGETAGMLSVEIEPKYEIPINPRWSLPIGVALGQTLVGAGRAQVRRTFVGLSIGIKRFYGHRSHLK